MSERFKIASACTFFLFSTIFLSFKIDRALTVLLPHSGDMLYQLIGSAQEAVGDTFFLKADSYFHGGTERIFSKEEEEHFDEDEHEPDHEADVIEVDRFGDWISQVNHQVHVSKHQHLSNSKIQEMLPYLSFAIKLDPYNVEAILSTSYWLERRLHKTDEAIEVLSQGLKNNPDAWQIDYRLGLIYFSKKTEMPKAQSYFKEAIRKIKPNDFQEAAEPYYYLAESCVAQNHYSEAVEAYQKALALFADPKSVGIRQNIRKKIAQIASFSSKPVDSR